MLGPALPGLAAVESSVHLSLCRAWRGNVSSHLAFCVKIGRLWRLACLFWPGTRLPVSSGQTAETWWGRGPPTEGMKTHNAYLLLALTTLFWAGNSIAGKLAVGHVSPMIIVVLRWSSVAIALYCFNRKRVAEDWSVVRTRLPYLVVMGTLGFTVFSVAIYYALVYTSALNASILQGSMPLFVFLVSYVLFSSRVVKQQVIGFLLSFLGVGVVAAQGALGNLLTLNVNVGDLLMLVAIIAYAVYTGGLRSKPAMHWTSLMVVLCVAAAITSLPLLAIEMLQGATVLPDARGWLIVLYVVIFPTLLSQIFFIRAVELIGPNRAGLFINLLPVWGALLATTLLGESFHLYHGVALGLILTGIGLAEYGGRRSGGDS